jgi:hypothetical protein
MAGDEKKRDERARRLREEIDRLRSGAEVEPKSPREFLDRAAREKKRPRREAGEEGGGDEG